MTKDKQERPETAAPAIQLKNISKSFGPVQANKNISLTPHIGAATQEAQNRIGEELATQIIEILS